PTCPHALLCSFFKPLFSIPCRCRSVHITLFTCPCLGGKRSPTRHIEPLHVDKIARDTDERVALCLCVIAIDVEFDVVIRIDPHRVRAYQDLPSTHLPLRG